LLDDTASSGISAPGLEVPLLKANLLHPDHSIGSNGDDAALFAAIGSRYDLNEIAFSNALSHVDEPPARRNECVNRTLQSTPSRGKYTNRSLRGPLEAPPTPKPEPLHTKLERLLSIRLPPEGEEIGRI